MHKIYSRPRIKLPWTGKKRNFNVFSKGINIIGENEKEINCRNNRKNKRNINKIQIIVVLLIAVLTAKFIINAISPIYNTLCEDKAKSLATIISNEQATNVMRNHSYDEIFSIEKDNNGNITMIKSNIIPINEIISDVAVKIQNEIDNEGRDDIEIAIRKFYRN